MSGEGARVAKQAHASEHCDEHCDVGLHASGYELPYFGILFIYLFIYLSIYSRRTVSRAPRLLKAFLRSPELDPFSTDFL